MPTFLRSQLSDLACRVASDVLDAIRGASIEDLLAESSGRSVRDLARPARAATHRAASAILEGTPTVHRAKVRGGRLARRTPAEIEKTLATVVSLVKSKKAGLRSEQIQKGALGLHRREMPRALKQGLSSEKVRRKGQKRGATYFAT